jgi:hypothetical protein
VNLSRLRSAFVLTLACATAPLAAHAQPCAPVVDPCCAARPSYTDLAYASFTGSVMVGTRELETLTGTNAVVTIFDLTPSYPGDGVDFSTVQRYHGPGNSWNLTNLGTVFGLTVDKYGNVFVCHTTCYGSDATGPGGDGAIYRIANGTGAINTFCVLPNTFGVGLGNISYDCEHDQFFVTDHEDGRIYRIKTATPNAPAATIQETFDPMNPDDGLTGFAPLGERLWGVQWHGGRVYYAVWSQNCNETSGPPNSIRSLALDGSGAFVPGSDQVEVVLPPFTANYSNPVSDISFSPKGTMLLAERSMSGPSSPAAHESRLLEYSCDPASGLGGWSPGGTYVVGVPATCCCSFVAGNGTNSAGGVDADFDPYSPGTPFGRVWNTADAINYSLTEYGVQGLPPGGGIPANSSWVDFDGSPISEKTNMGDIEVPCADQATATTLALFTAEPAGTGLAVRWQFGAGSDVSSATLERSFAASGPWEAVSAERRRDGDAILVVDRDAPVGRPTFYRLSVVTLAGDRLTFGPVSGTAIAPIAKFAIARLTPNPIQNSVDLEFAVPREAAIRLTVLDVQGREITTLAEGTYRPGRYAAHWDGAGASGRGGVYFIRYRTPAGDFTQRVIFTP